MKKYVLFVLSLLFWLVETQCFASPQIQIGNNPPQDVEVEGKVESTDVQVGKPFTLDLSLKVPYGWFVEWNDFSNDTLTEQLDIINRGEVERTADADSNVIVKQQLTLMTFDTGQVQVPSIGLVYARSFDDPNRLAAYTDPIRLYSTTMAIDTTQAFKPIVDPIAAPVTMKEVFPWILAALLLILLVLAVWLLLRRRKRKGNGKGNVVRGPVIPPYEKAVGDLENLRQQKLWQSGKVKEYFSMLTDIAREYIEGQFGVNAVEMTTDEILKEVQPLQFSQETYDKLKETMEVADLVKFAKYSTSNLESENAMTRMTEFVNESYAQYQKTMSPSAETQSLSSSASPQTDESKSLSSASPQTEQPGSETQSAATKEEVKDV